MVHEVFPGAVVMPTLAQNIVRGNFFEAGDGVILAEDAAPTNCRRLTKESEADDGKECSAGHEKPACGERHDEKAGGTGCGNLGADGIF